MIRPFFLRVVGGRWRGSASESADDEETERRKADCASARRLPFRLSGTLRCGRTPAKPGAGTIREPLKIDQKQANSQAQNLSEVLPQTLKKSPRVSEYKDRTSKKAIFLLI